MLELVWDKYPHHVEHAHLLPCICSLGNSLLIPLNVCRKKNMYKSWECDHERHVYEQSVVHSVAFQTC